MDIRAGKTILKPLWRCKRDKLDIRVFLLSRLLQLRLAIAADTEDQLPSTRREQLSQP